VTCNATNVGTVPFVSCTLQLLGNETPAEVNLKKGSVVFSIQYSVPLRPCQSHQSLHGGQGTANEQDGRWGRARTDVVPCGVLGAQDFSVVHREPPGEERAACGRTPVVDLQSWIAQSERRVPSECPIPIAQHLLNQLHCMGAGPSLPHSEIPTRQTHSSGSPLDYPG
jgi:hypothetical protein